MSSKERLGISGREICSFLLSHVGGAAAEAEEDEHEDDLGAPDVDVGGVVISHGPHEAAGGVREGAVAEGGGVLVEEEGGRDDDDAELEQAGAAGAVDAENSESVLPGADEHEERVESDDAEGDSVEEGNDGETGAGFLAVHVAVLDKLNVLLEALLV